MPKMPKMPIDVMAVLQEATDVEAARSVPLCVSVLLDDTAPDDLTAFVRSSFASASPQARVSVNYFEDAHIAFDARSDMAVIAAGFTPEIGEIVSRLHGEGIPVMVVTTLPECVNGAAEAAGHPIDAADVIAPNPEIDGVVTLHEPLVVTKEGAISGREVDPEDPFSLEPLPMCAAYHEQLRTKMGEWVVAAFREKRLAFAQAFDFVRKPLSMESVRSTAFQNAGIGLVIFIPGADFPIMTLNQTKMVIQIAAAYGQPLSADRVKELAAVVGGGLVCRTVARQVAGLVPAVGWAVKAGVGYAGTWAMGMAAAEYFEHGGNMAGVGAVVDEARAAASRAADETAAGRAAKGFVASLGLQAKDAATAAFVPPLRRRLRAAEPCVLLRMPQRLPRRLRPLVLPERAPLPMPLKLRRTIPNNMTRVRLGWRTRKLSLPAIVFFDMRDFICKIFGLALRGFCATRGATSAVRHAI